MKKIISPLIYIGEWVLFFAALTLFSVFNFINLFNLIYVDMPWEEPIVLSTNFVTSLVVVVGVGVLIFLYVKNVTGNKVYNMSKQILWAALLGTNTFSSVFWLILSFSTQFSMEEMILRLLISLICIALTTQTILFFRNEKKMRSELKKVN